MLVLVEMIAISTLIAILQWILENISVLAKLDTKEMVKTAVI